MPLKSAHLQSLAGQLRIAAEVSDKNVGGPESQLAGFARPLRDRHVQGRPQVANRRVPLALPREFVEFGRSGEVTGGGDTAITPATLFCLADTSPSSSALQTPTLFSFVFSWATALKSTLTSWAVLL